MARKKPTKKPSDYGVIRIPKVGDRIYGRSHAGDREHPDDAFAGGLVEIDEVWEDGAEDRPTLWVSVEGSNFAYNWSHLEKDQHKLRADYHKERKMIENMQNDTPESYKCLAVSTAHLTDRDKRALSSLAGEDQMIFERDCGYFIKLYEPAERGDDDLNYREGLSHYFKNLIEYAVNKGYRMIEFDRDVEVLDIFPTHE